MAKAACKQSRWPWSGLISIFEKRNPYDIGWYIKAHTELGIYDVDDFGGDVYMAQ